MWNSSMSAWSKVALGSGVSKRIYLTKSPRQEHPKESWVLEAAGTVYPTCRQDKERKWHAEVLLRSSHYCALWQIKPNKANDIFYQNCKSRVLRSRCLIPNVYIKCYISWFVEGSADTYNVFWSGTKCYICLGFSGFSFWCVTCDMLS